MTYERDQRLADEIGRSVEHYRQNPDEIYKTHGLPSDGVLVAGLGAWVLLTGWLGWHLHSTGAHWLIWGTPSFVSAGTLLRMLFTFRR